MPWKSALANRMETLALIALLAGVGSAWSAPLPGRFRTRRQPRSVFAVLTIQPRRRAFTRPIRGGSDWCVLCAVDSGGISR